MRNSQSHLEMVDFAGIWSKIKFIDETAFGNVIIEAKWRLFIQIPQTLCLLHIILPPDS